MSTLYVASKNRRLSNAIPARPYIWRLSIFNRLMCPSTGVHRLYGTIIRTGLRDWGNEVMVLILDTTMRGKPATLSRFNNTLRQRVSRLVRNRIDCQTKVGQSISHQVGLKQAHIVLVISFLVIAAVAASVLLR
jgi:hypothetical protein